MNMYATGVATQRQVHVCTCKQCIGMAPEGKAPLHMKAFMPFRLERCLLSFRLGTHNLRVAIGRQEQQYDMGKRKRANRSATKDIKELVYSWGLANC